MPKKVTKKEPKEEPKVCGPANSGEVIHVNDAPCSVELSRDAKGQARWAIKLYGNRDDMDNVVDQVLSLDGRLKAEA